MKKLFGRSKSEVPPTLQVSTQPTPFPMPIQFISTDGHEDNGLTRQGGMKASIGRDNLKPKDPPLQIPTQQTPITTPIHQRFASSGRPRESTDDDRWEILDSQHTRAMEREHRDEENELTRKIGFLTATASEDWALVLDVCEHASANENNAREAVRALRREFRYGKPAAQLAAARLWAIMLQNTTDTFITQCTSRKFLDILEYTLGSSCTAPVVRERLMDVLAAAAYASGAKKESRFRGLWRRVKPRDKPEEGVPFDTDDAMFNPPLNALRHAAQGYEFENTDPTVVVYPGGTQTAPETPPIATKQPLQRKNSDVTPDEKSSGKSHRDHHRGIIPPDEDMRRLFQECKIGVGNANLLNEALATATPELRNPVISEFYKKCVDSQELIFTQIPWASAGAERSRASKDQVQQRERGERKRKTSATPNGSLPDITTPASTREEELLAELLAANEHLREAIDLYKDLERVTLERDAEERNRREVRIDPRQRARITEDGTLHNDSAVGSSGMGSASRSRSPSPIRNPVVQHLLGAPGELSLQVVPPAPHGPRIQGSARVLRLPEHATDDDHQERPILPSAKALGKRRVVADPVDRIDSADDGISELNEDSDDEGDTPHGLSPPPIFDQPANDPAVADGSQDVWAELKPYLEAQTESIVYVIQSVLLGVRTPRPSPTLNENLTRIITIVSSIVAVCNDNLPPATAQQGNDILRELSEHANHLSEVQALPEVTKESRQVMAKSSFAIANAMKGLMKL
ncbi:hypothetical protein FB45DRAFT_839940 [Roridomyces roridus]|uniref:VHS domain-containing protein n=1 Tax=Roridomyces roridus TaxID=1738132 RepID=A0AAD7FGW2_9AGAR|nr:hypothetical protein FB45DRAFT_839940 [Roridomyces roridus]